MRDATAFLSTALLLLVVHAAPAEAPQPSHNIKVDDYFSLATLFDCAVSADCIITKTDRFKAASSGAGIVDTIME